MTDVHLAFSLQALSFRAVFRAFLDFKSFAWTDTATFLRPPPGHGGGKPALDEHRDPCGGDLASCFFGGLEGVYKFVESGPVIVSLS
jgi:hypothetical protein